MNDSMAIECFKVRANILLLTKRNLHSTAISSLIDRSCPQNYLTKLGLKTSDIKYVIISHAHGDHDQGAAELQSRFGVELYITRTHPRLVEGTAQGVDKGSGLRKLCELLGIRPARVLAIGDNDNDIPLLQAAGYGVAMGNCTPGLRAVADWVAPSVSEDGVAVALEKLVLARL